ncbi:LysR family transcriptional regulator [Terasakiella sp.]|uniref:LysR family transcriptional regulator n=1 Tax=Terasakiella sp. TaxID=2034861 RepID=UPI003AA83160
MDIKQLRIFLNVAETGSFSDAAKRLNVTQPALSRQIRLLEEDSGSPLFIRTGRGVRLSEAGEKMLPRARLLIEEMERLRMDMTAFAGELHGRVRLGLPPSVGSVLAGPVVERFHRDYPNVKLRVTQLLSGALQESLLNGRLDIGILFEGNVSPALRSRPLWSERLFFITTPHERWQGVEMIDYADCLSHPFILPGPKHGLRDVLEQAARKIDKRLNVVVEAESLAVQMELVCRGLGCTILSFEACKNHIDAGRLIAIPIINPDIERVCSLVWSRDYSLTRATHEMADVITEIAGVMFSSTPKET